MKLRHFDHDGRARFITFATHRRIPLLTNDLYKRMIVDSFKSVCNEHRIQPLAWVVMPEHIHLVLIPPLELKIGWAIGEIKRLSSRQILQSVNSDEIIKTLTVIRNGKSKRAIWQRRCYDHNCRTRDVVTNKIMYCHMNPVRRGLVQDMADHVWSSSRWYSGLTKKIFDVDS